MEENIFKLFFDNIIKMDDDNYIKAIIAYHTAPVAFGHRPSVLLSFKNSIRKVYDTWKANRNEIILNTNIEYYSLNETPDSALLLFYNRANLIKNLSCPKHREFLEHLGYSNSLSLEEYLIMLSSKFSYECPHEVGIFLGIPLEDINSFIKNNGKEYIKCGYWKVYHNPNSAIKMFKKYDKAKLVVIKSMLQQNIKNS